VYPVGTGPIIDNEAEDNLSAQTVSAVGKPEKTRLETPTLPSNISAYRSDVYTTERYVQTVHEKNISERNVSIYGLPSNEPVTYPPNEISVQRVFESNLSIRSVGTNYSAERPPTEVNATLYNESGDGRTPVNGNKISGQIFVSDTSGQKSVDIGEDGNVSFYTNETGVVEIEYQPRYYIESQKKFVGDKAYAKAVALPEAGTIARWLVEMGLQLLPIVLLFYMINGLRSMFRLRQETEQQKRKPEK
jgi:hypothetical protein